MTATITSRKLPGGSSQINALLVVCFTIFLTGQVSSVRAAPSLAVGLISFSASPLDSAVRLRWETGTELNTAGFKMKRVTGSETVFLMPGDVEALNSEQIEPFPPEGHAFIWSKGTPATGAIYLIADRSAVNGQTYTYTLIEVESNSHELALAAVTITAGIPTTTPTSTPIIITDDPSGTSEAGNPTQPTALPTRTSRPTATTTSDGTDTAAAAPTTRAVTTQTNVAPGPVSTPSATPFPTLSSSVGPGQLAAGTSAPVTPDGDASDQVISPVNQEVQLGTVPIAIAQTEPEATPSEGYPGTDQTTLPEDADNLVPPAFGSPTFVAPYPAGGGTNIATPVPIIGSQGTQVQPTPSAVASVNRVLLGRIYLWGAFVIALLIFITAVIGSIILFTRKH